MKKFASLLLAAAFMVSTAFAALDDHKKDDHKKDDHKKEEKKKPH
jgi:protein involved in sex pheromone biosynthesis